MIEWYVKTKQILRNIERKSKDAKRLYEEGGQSASAQVNGYLKADLQQLREHWLGLYPTDSRAFEQLARHISFGMDGDYSDMVRTDIPTLEEQAEGKLLADGKNQHFGFEELLHPVIKKSSYQLYRDGHLREAVLNSITALFDYIRTKTRTDDDGDKLIGRVFSVDKPVLVLSELQTESGQNDQKGFMQIFKGAYQGIRNPKAHSMTHDLTETKAAQYLIFASLLARRIEEAQKVK